ncbi:MAG: endolytic transglycosylase MltG [Rickettsiales bacterium]|nr:endolytic transglycosylase MltG [Rickettsiales bacterium]
MVNKGDNFKEVVDNLIDKDVIQPINKKLFFYLSKIIYRNKITIKAGEYLFIKTDTPLMILKKLKKGEIYYRKLTFAEGLSNDTILKMINSAKGLVGELPTEEIEEGSLLPETYLYTTGETKKSIVLRMQKAMIQFFDEQWDAKADNLPFTTKREALSLASIVEKETGIQSERGKVASVFINRLKRHMRLQSDPTVVYTFAKGNIDLERPIKKSDLARVSEYNTYIVKGIPDKPIANPGKNAIIATLNPEKTNFLYFVATGNGGHNFSKTLKEHNKFVEKYREIIQED